MRLISKNGIDIWFSESVWRDVLEYARLNSKDAFLEEAPNALKSCLGSPTAEAPDLNPGQ